MDGYSTIAELDALDQKLLAQLDILLADRDSSLDAFYELLTKDDRCASIWNTLCSAAARNFCVDRKAVFDQACEAFKRSLQAHGPHDWLGEHREGFVAWFSETARNHIRNVRRIQVRCNAGIVKIGEKRRTSCNLARHCVRTSDPAPAMDLIRAVRDMPEELQAVFLRRCQSQLVGDDVNGPEIRKTLSDAEIARELDISVPTVKRRWAKALEYLQQRLPDLRISDKAS